MPRAFARDTQLRDLLSRDGLDSSGERSELEARHKAFVSRYNTLVDGQVNLTDGERRSADRLRSEASREVAKGERARAYCAVQQKQASREWWEATAGARMRACVHPRIDA